MAKQRERAGSRGASEKEAWIHGLGRRFLDEIKHHSGSIFRSGFWQNKALGWYMANDDLKIQMLRFVDTLPVLTSSAEVVRHLKEYFPRENVRLPATLRAGVAIAGFGLGRVAASITDFAVKTSAKHFISYSEAVSS